MLPFLATLSPNTAILMLTAGIGLIAVELNRPGTILPGAAGLLLTLLSEASLWQRHPRPAPTVLILLSMALLLLQIRRSLHWVIPATATGLLIFSLEEFLPPSAGPGVGRWTALVCGVLLGAGTTVLTRIARRARQNKGLD